MTYGNSAFRTVPHKEAICNEPLFESPFCTVPAGSDLPDGAGLRPAGSCGVPVLHSILGFPSLLFSKAC